MKGASMNKILIMIGISIAALASLVSCKENAEKRTVIPVRLDYDGRNANETMPMKLC